MEFEQVYAAAESDSHQPDDSRCARVYISAFDDASAIAGIAESIQEEITRRGLDARIINAGTMGCFDLEPVVVIEKPGRSGGVTYGNMTPPTAAEIVGNYLLNDIPGPALCSTGSEKISGIPHISELPLFTGQSRLALRNCGYIIPEMITDYIVRGRGYSGLAGALQMGRAEALSRLKTSGLRDGGGDGCLTADKWQECLDGAGEDKYIICNAFDADPQSMTARLLLRSDPHSVLEGLLIGAYTVGATRCIICIDAEDKNGISIITTAIEQMRPYDLLGTNILDSDFNADIELREITVSLVSGDDTALIRLLEGKQARPSLATNYAAPRGYNGSPAVVNSAETFANVSGIFQNGPEWLSGTGTENCKGTKIVTLSNGAAPRLVVEVPFGTTLRTLLEDIGGWDLKEMLAVRFGGSTGAFFAADELDVPITYEAMAGAGSLIGSGAAIVIGSGLCPVEAAREAVSYLQAESCGQCVFCREGTFQISEILDDIAEFKGKHEDLEMLEELGGLMKKGCICGLGSNASNPVLSSLRLFRDDYKAHINEKRCPASGPE
jgi:NADH:ubiquinone oxidoreductase subunit F (NADH-binding)